MVVGAIEETVTVSGQAPVVDISNVQQQTSLTRATLDAIPTSRRPAQLQSLILGADAGPPIFTMSAASERPRLFRRPRPAPR